jgi:hypothetical protein
MFLASAALAAFAGTCVVQNSALTRIDSHDTFAGELKNDSGVNILQHRFKVAFLDASGNVIETRLVDGCLRSIQDGESDFFSAPSSADPSVTSIGLARLANFAEDPNFTIGTTEASDISIDVTSVIRVEDTLTVTGTVKNNASTTLNDPVACAVVYNRDNQVVVVDKDDTLSNLDQDESDTFSITITVPESTSKVDHVDVWVDGIDESTDKPVDPESDKGNDVTVHTPTPTSTSTPTPTNTPVPTSTP